MDTQSILDTDSTTSIVVHSINSKELPSIAVETMVDSGDNYGTRVEPSISKQEPTVIVSSSSKYDPAPLIESTTYVVAESPESFNISPTLSISCSHQFPMPIVLSSKPDNDDEDEDKTLHNDGSQTELQHSGINGSIKQKSPDWSNEELHALIQAVKALGTNWKRIISDPIYRSMFKPERTALSLKTKWFRIKASPEIVSVFGPPRKRGSSEMEPVENVEGNKVIMKSLDKFTIRSDPTKVASRSKGIEFSHIRRSFMQTPEDSSLNDSPISVKRKLEESPFALSKAHDGRFSLLSKDRSLQDRAEDTMDIISEKADSTDNDQLSNDDSFHMKKRRTISKSGRSTRNTKLFQVEKILSHRFADDGLQFLVKWNGYNQSYDSWEPLQILPKISLQRLFLPLYYSEGEGLPLTEICKIAQFIANN